MTPRHKYFFFANLILATFKTDSHARDPLQNIFFFTLDSNEKITLERPRDWERQTDRQKRHIDKKQKDKKDRQKNMQKDRQTKKTDRHTNKKTDIQTHRLMRKTHRQANENFW